MLRVPPPSVGIFALIKVILLSVYAKLWHQFN
uniref:Uncharacterized protein n=1 Tax=Rhizophora mucronata TaxID=61149 RepID=A0A2P2P6T3_RHIMU